MKILVTGGSGFIGTNLVRELLAEGHAVSIFDKQQSESYPEIAIVGDVRDKDAFAKALEGMEVVYHLAAEHRDDVRPIQLYYDVNVGGAQNLVHAAEQNRVQRLIFTSSVAVYGLNVGEPTETSPVNPFNDYSKSKYEAEKVFTAWAHKDPARTLVMIRPVVIFGEKNRGNVYNLLTQIASGQFIMVGDGRNEKSMAYVLNLCAFLKKVLDTPAGVHLYNYSDKPDMSMQDFLKTTFESLGKKRPLLRIPYPVGLLGGYLFDVLAILTGKTFPFSSIRVKKFTANTKVAADKVRQTGFQAPYSLAEGLRRMIESEFPRC